MGKFLHAAAQTTIMAGKMCGIFAGCALAAVLMAVVSADQTQLSFHRLSSSNSDFAFTLYKSLNAKAASGKNIFYSPLGISTALSMLSTGARSDTHSQVFSTLGYNSFNQTQVNEAYGNLFHMFGHGVKNQQLDVGNAVALNSGFSPLEKFVADIKQYYSGDMLNVDMTKPGEAVAEINSYVANKTHDNIKDMVKDLDPDMVMVLINFVYFRGQWEKPFNHEATGKADFQLEDSSKVQVDMMRRKGYYKTYWDAVNHTTVVMLPYKGNSSMMIVLPDVGKMKEVEGYINKDYITRWRNSVSMNYIRLLLPKFSISAEASLKSMLKEMGITKIFEDTADFSGLSSNVKVKVSKASHKAALSVTEMGTEAAATTIVEINFLSLPPAVEINRPFLVFILENSTGSILFMGKINNPTAK